MSGIQARFRLDWPGFTLDVELDLPARGVTALFGHSGSGKTTLLRCIAGLERAPLGCLTVNGAVWQNDEHPGKRGGHWLPTHQRPLGYVFQEARLFAHLSVLGNLRYGLAGLEAQAGNFALPGAPARRAGYSRAVCQPFPRRSGPPGPTLGGRPGAVAWFAGLGADQGGGADWLGLARHFFGILIKLACSPYAASAGSYIFSIKHHSTRCTDVRQSHSDPSESGSGGQCGRHGRHPGAGKRCQWQVNAGAVLLA